MTTAKNPDTSSEVFRALQSEHLHLFALSFTNGYFLSLCKKKDVKLGTMALSLPSATPTGRFMKRRREKEERLPRRGKILTTTLLGTRNEAITRALAEKVVQRSNKLVYCSVNFPENTPELFVEALQLVEEFLRSDNFLTTE